MNCRPVSPLLYAERDGVLTPAQHDELGRHCATCAACEQLRSDLAAGAAVWRAQVANVAVPNADAEWRRVQSMIHAPAAKRKRKLAPVIWLSAPLAAAAAIAFAFFVNPTSPPVAMPPPPLAAEVATAEVAHADYVEAGDTNASTMVYVDKDSGWLVVWASDADTKTSG
jgi:hypothetical protein